MNFKPRLVREVTVSGNRPTEHPLASGARDYANACAPNDHGIAKTVRFPSRNVLVRRVDGPWRKLMRLFGLKRGWRAMVAPVQDELSAVYSRAKSLSMESARKCSENIERSIKNRFSNGLSGFITGGIVRRGSTSLGLLELPPPPSSPWPLSSTAVARGKHKDCPFAI